PLLGHRGTYRSDLEDGRVNVAAARDRRGVRKPLRGRAGRLLDLERAVAGLDPRLDDRHRRYPRANVLRRDVRAAHIAEIVVEARRIHFANSVCAAIAEQHLPRKLLAAEQNFRDPPITELDADPFTGLRRELQADPIAVDRRMLPLKRRQTDGAVL